MPPSRRTSIGLAKRERTRTSLIEAAYRVFARKEFEAVTIDEIIAEAGVARGTFYNYFQTREEILKAVAAFLREEMKQKLGILTIDDPAARMAIAIRLFLHQAIRDQTWGGFVVRLGLMAVPLSETIEEGIVTDLEAGIRSKRFPVESQQAAMALILGTGLMAARTILAKDLTGDLEPDYPEQITQIILKALGIPETEAHSIAFKPLDVVNPS